MNTSHHRPSPFDHLNETQAKTVFVAEDQTILRDLISRVLQGFPNIRVVGACGDGQKAVAQCLEIKPDIIILDIMMPLLNGIDVLRHIKAKLPNTRVLIFSEASSRSVIKQAIEAGVDGFIEKAVEIRELEKALERIASGESYFGPRITEIMRKIMLNPEQDNSLKTLTPRERQVLQLIAEGYTSKEIAKVIDISYKTVDTHRSNIMHKLDMHSVAELTRFAISMGLTDKLKHIE
jgi:DNA-binding NarL/FixJ family response regulator